MGWNVDGSEAISMSRNPGECPRPVPGSRRPGLPDLGDGPIDRLTLAAVDEIEAAVQLIHQVARRIGERPAFPPEFRVATVVDSSMADVHPIPVGDDDRGARVVNHGVLSSRCPVPRRLAWSGSKPTGPRDP